MNLVLVSHIRQVCSLAANVGNRRHCVTRQLALYIEMPLLDVWPEDLAFDCCRWKVVHQRRWKCATAANACVSSRRAAATYTGSNVGLERRQNSRRSAFERFRISFVSIGIFLKNSIPCANRHLPVALRIECESNSRAPVDIMSFLTSGQ